MFLSRLLPNPHCRQARRDLALVYELHRTVLCAFTDKADGGPGRVLFRVDVPRDSGAAVVLVQSEKPPDWSFLRPDYLPRPAESKPFDPTFIAGQRLAFRLRANPTRKTGTPSKSDRLAGRAGGNGRRLGLLGEDQQREWLGRKAEAGGFDVLG